LASETIEVPIAGKMMDIMVEVGNQVNEGDVICTLESMKMENPILSPVSGTVKEIRVSPAQAVKPGEVIAIIEY
jgi:biotin carboxyl carrier protein